MLKTPKNSAKKLNFWLIFGSFSITPSYALSVTPQFLCQIKGLMKMYNRGKFHLYSICGCQVIKFEMFSWRCSIHEMAHFGGFLGPNSPKCGPIRLKFGPRLFLMEIKTLLQEFFKNSNFSRNRTFPKFARFFGFCPTLRPFFSMKEAEIEKSKYFQRQNYAIGLSEYRKINALSGPNFSGKIRLLFVPFWPFFGEKRGVVTF